MEDIEVIEEIEKIANEDNVSFSQVIMQKLKEVYHEKKAFEAAAKGENISVRILGYNPALAAIQQQSQEQQSPKQERKSSLVKTLDSWIDHNIVGQRDWEPALTEVESIPKLEKYAILGRNIITAANKQVANLKIVYRSSRNGVSG